MRKHHYITVYFWVFMHIQIFNSKEKQKFLLIALRKKNSGDNFKCINIYLFVIWWLYYILHL